MDSISEGQVEELDDVPSIQEVVFSTINQLAPMQQLNHLQSQPRACCQSEFILDSQLIDAESIWIDYKQYNWPIVQPAITKRIAIEILSFLNCDGGALLIGINDQDYRVKGVSLTTKNREEFQKYVDDKILGFIHPIVKNEIEISFLPILQSDQWKKNLYVIRIIVQQGRVDTLYTFSSEPNEMISAIRRQSSCYTLRHEQIKAEIINRLSAPIRYSPPHNCVPPNREGIISSCLMSSLEKEQQNNMLENSGETQIGIDWFQKSQNQNIEEDQSELKIIYLQFIQSNDDMHELSRLISRKLNEIDVKTSIKMQHKQVQIIVKKKKQIMSALAKLKDLQHSFNKYHESLARISLSGEKVFSIEIPTSRTIIFSNIDRNRMNTFKELLINELEGVFILPLEYNVIIEVDDLKLALNYLNRKRRVLAKYCFKNTDVRYGLTDNLKLSVQNLILEKKMEFGLYFDQISCGINCKGEDNDDTITLYFPTLVDLILASERLQFLMYSDPSFRKFGKNNKLFIQLEIFVK